MEPFAARSPEASRLRQRKYELVRQHQLPEWLVGGCLCKTHRRCGRANCHCSLERGHPLWSLTFSDKGKRRVERVPVSWVAQLEQAVLQTQAYMDALKEIMAINVELLVLTRRQQQVRRRTSKSKNRHSTARRREEKIAGEPHPADP